MSDEHEFSLIMPFWIDTDAYTARDRDMFVAGYEFCQLYEQMKSSEEFSATIHRENESRVRMIAGKMQRKISIEPCSLEHDPEGTWSYLTILAN